MPALAIVTLGLMSIVTLAAAIWLLLHLNAVAAMFAGTADIVASAQSPRTSRRRICIALAAFNFGWIACIAIWLAAIGTSTTI